MPTLEPQGCSLSPLPFSPGPTELSPPSPCPQCPPSRTGHEASLESLCQLQAGAPGALGACQGQHSQNWTFSLQMINVSCTQSCSGTRRCPEPAGSGYHPQVGSVVLHLLFSPQRSIF